MRKLNLLCVAVALALSFVLPTVVKVCIVAIIGVGLFIAYDEWDYEQRVGGTNR